MILELLFLIETAYKLEKKKEEKRNSKKQYRIDRKRRKISTILSLQGAKHYDSIRPFEDSETS